MKNPDDIQKIQENEYQCELCGCVFRYGWSDDEAQAEMKRSYGDISTEQCGKICDYCYQAFQADVRRNPNKYLPPDRN